eukprot:g5881.t1
MLHRRKGSERLDLASMLRDYRDGSAYSAAYCCRMPAARRQGAPVSLLVNLVRAATEANAAEVDAHSRRAPEARDFPVLNRPNAEATPGRDSPGDECAGWVEVLDGDGRVRDLDGSYRARLLSSQPYRGHEWVRIEPHHTASAPASACERVHDAAPETDEPVFDANQFWDANAGHYWHAKASGERKVRLRSVRDRKPSKQKG